MFGIDDAIGLGLGAVETITGLINSGKAKAEAAALEKTRPKYSITPESKDELSLSESELSKGMSSKAERAYTELSGGDFANSLDAILKGGGSVNNIGALYGANEGGRQKLALIEDDIRMRQLTNLISSRRNMTDQKDKQFEFNEWMPWSDKAKAVAGARVGADKQIFEGLGTMGAAGMRYGQNKRETDMWDKYLNPTQPKETQQFNNPTVYNPLDFSTPDLYQSSLNNQYADIG